MAVLKIPLISQITLALFSTHYRQLVNSKSGNAQKTIVASPILFAVRHNLPMYWVKP